MKKVFLIDPQARNKGSLAVYDYSLFSQMRNAVYTFYGNSDFGLEKKFGNLKFVGLFHYQKYNGIVRGLSYTWSMIMLLLKTIIKRPDTIHVEWIRLWSVDYIIYSLIKILARPKMVYTVHNVLPHEAQSVDRNRYRKLYGLMDILIVHTDASKNDLMALSPEIRPEVIKVIPHGILQLSINEDKVKEEMKRIESKYDLHDKIVFAIVGTQSKYKGTDLLLSAWNNCPQLSDNNKIVLLSIGRFEDDVVPFNPADNVIVINRIVSDEEFVASIRLASVIVLPYRSIDQSGVLMTCINEGTPYCSTDVGELCQPIDFAGVGWKISSPTIEEIKNTLLYLINNKDVINEKKNNIKAWNKARSLYDWGEISKTTEQLYV